MKKQRVKFQIKLDYFPGVDRHRVEVTVLEINTDESRSFDKDADLGPDRLCSIVNFKKDSSSFITGPIGMNLGTKSQGKIDTTHYKDLDSAKKWIANLTPLFEYAGFTRVTHNKLQEGEILFEK